MSAQVTLKPNNLLRMPIKETDEAACVAWLMRMYQELTGEKK